MTWYGLRSLTRSSQTDLSSPIETQTSVYRKSTPLTPSAGSSVSVIRAPVCSAMRPALGDEVVVRPEVLRRAQPDVHAQLGAADQQRVAHVVAGVAEVAVRDLRQRLVAELGHRQDVGEDLGRVELVGQAVPDRHAGELGELLDDLLAEAAVLDAVEDPAEDAGRVLHRLLVADLRPARARGRSRGRPGRRPRPRTATRVRVEVFSKMIAMFLPRSRCCSYPPYFARFRSRRQVEQEVDLARREVEQLDEAAIAQVEAHRRCFPRRRSGRGRVKAYPRVLPACDEGRSTRGRPDGMDRRVRHDVHT